MELDLTFNNVKPKDWYFVLDLVQFRTILGCVRLITIFFVNGVLLLRHFLLKYLYTIQDKITFRPKQLVDC